MEDCSLCRVAATNPAYRRAWSVTVTAKKHPPNDVGKISVVTLIPLSYVHRARECLASMARLKSCECWCIAYDFDPAVLSWEYPHVRFVPMARHPFEWIQWGPWLDALPDATSRVLIHCDADTAFQRDLLPQEIERFNAYDDRTFGVGMNDGPYDSLFDEGKRGNLDNDDAYYGTWDSLQEIRCFNVGFMVASRTAWRTLQERYRPEWLRFDTKCHHPARCQWLICWCLAKLGLTIDELGNEIHCHGHFGTPPNVEWKAHYKDQLILFKHAMRP